MRRFSAHLGYLFTELPLGERFAAAKQAGFTAVEHPAPYAMPAREVLTCLVDSGLPFMQLALPAGDPARGDKGLAALPDRLDEFRCGIGVGLDYAEQIGCHAVHAMSGVSPAGVSEALLWDTYLANLAAAADAAAARGITLLIEPIGRATLAGYYMSTPDLGVRAIEELERPNVKLIFDIFHAVNDDVDPLAFIRNNAPLIHHIHIADHSGRHEPGTGNIDFSSIYKALDDIGYSGVIGCEYLPIGSTEEGLAWVRQNLFSYQKGAADKIIVQ